MVEGGGTGPEIIFINEHESLDAVSATKEKFMCDPELIDYFHKAGKYIYHVENNLCVAAPGIEWEPPKQCSKHVLESHKPKGFPLQTVATLYEYYELWAKYAGEHAHKPCGMLCPVAFSHACVFSLYPVVDNKYDPAYHAVGQMFEDKHNWPKISEYYTKFEEQSVRLLSPVPLEHVHKMAEQCKIQ